MRVDGSNNEVSEMGTNNHPFKVGQKVRPAGNGEDASGRLLAWTKLRGVVVNTWVETYGAAQKPIYKVEIRWSVRAPYPTRLEAHWVVAV